MRREMRLDALTDNGFSGMIGCGNRIQLALQKLF
jgi:hypothetical protein